MSCEKIQTTPIFIQAADECKQTEQPVDSADTDKRRQIRIQMTDLFERVAVAIYETDEINQMGGEDRIPLRSCHPGHQKRIDRMAQAALNAVNSYKESEHG